MAGADMVIRVVDFCGPHCVSGDDAERLFDRLQDALRVGKSVQLDFAGIETIATVFLNVAIGKLFGEFPPERVDRLLEWRNLESVDDRLMRLVIKNAKAHYQLGPDARARQAQLLKRALEPQ